jgi:drug/metabolite transporter (DMT)-like permease
VFNNLVPVFGVLLGTLLLGETLLASMLVGGLIALAGVSLTNWSAAPGSDRAR